MLHTFFAASFALVMSTAGHSGVAQAKIERPVALASCQGRLAITRTFAGGQYVVHITRATGRMKGFMDVRAGDLLASYEFDSKEQL